MWEWDEAVLGPLTFDAERTLTFDGNNFMLRIEGHPDDETECIKSVSISLEAWLIEKVRDRDPNLLKDEKWKYRTLWHEYIRQTHVSFI